MITTRSYLIQNRAAVKAFAMAYTEGLHLYAQKRDFALSVTQKYTKLADQEVLAKSHDYFVKNTSLVPLTDPAAVVNALPPDKSATRKPEEFYDNSVVQELVNEGFVEKVKKAR